MTHKEGRSRHISGCWKLVEKEPVPSTSSMEKAPSRRSSLEQDSPYGGRSQGICRAFKAYFQGFVACLGGEEAPTRRQSPQWTALHSSAPVPWISRHVEGKARPIQGQFGAVWDRPYSTYPFRVDCPTSDCGLKLREAAKSTKSTKGIKFHALCTMYFLYFVYIHVYTCTVYLPTLV